MLVLGGGGSVMVSCWFHKVFRGSVMVSQGMIRFHDGFVRYCMVQ